MDVSHQNIGTFKCTQVKKKKVKNLFLNHKDFITYLKQLEDVYHYTILPENMI